MTVSTEIYGLEAFDSGESYSAEIDKRRFEIIDSQFDFYTRIIGNGRIVGWGVSVKNLASLVITVAPGSGLIDRFATYTYGNQDIALVDNRSVYLYMRRKIGVIGGFSGFSDSGSVTTTLADFVAPATPTGLSIVSSTYNSVSLNWLENAEIDIASYSVYRSTNNINFDLIASGLTTIEYVDETVSEDTTYYYRVLAVNRSGQESGATSSAIAVTPKDLRQPLPPGKLQAFARDAAVHLYWEESPSSFANEYTIEVNELGSDGNVSAFVEVISVPRHKTSVLVKRLTNNVKYKFTIRSISENNISSENLDILQTPFYSEGPSEAEDVTVVYSEGDNDDIDIVMTVSIEPPASEYFMPADRYYLIISENANRVTEPIVLSDGALSRDIRTLPFADEEGNISYDSFKEDTNYIVKVIGVDVLGNENGGTLVRARSPVFAKPPTPYNISIEQKANFSLVFSWNNSSSQYFKNNILSVTYKDAGSPTVTLVSELDIGTSTSYVVPSNLVIAGRTFDFELFSVDTYENESAVVDASFKIQDPSEAARPPIPNGQEVFSGDSQVTLRWNPILSEEIESYVIYRASFSFFPNSSNFTKIDTIPGSLSEYVDYEVSNGTRYIYFITSVNKFGVESLNPIDDSVTTQAYKTAFPRADTTFAIPSNVSASKSAYDVVVAWDAVTGSFDGYEIWRSVDNTYSYELVANVLPSTLTYTDEDILLESGVSIYYIVRTFRNEAEVFVSESNIAPQSSILLAEIQTLSGSISIDQTPARELLNFEDPVREETVEQINLHKHTYDNIKDIDRRIDLGSNIIISDFTTNNYRIFRTTKDISGASSFVVSVTGEVNEAYFKDENGDIDTLALEQARQGISPLLYTVNTSNKTVTFEGSLYASFLLPEEIEDVLDFINNPNQGDIEAQSSRIQAAFDLIRQGFTSEVVRPYKTPPVITLKLNGVKETQGTLEASRVESLSSGQVYSGEINYLQLPTIHHRGRIQELLTPDQADTKSSDQFIFELVSDKANPLTESQTFYDIFQVSADNIIAATSSGLLKSIDFGQSWTVTTTFPTSPHKIFYATSLDKYFILTNSTAYISQGDLSYWSEVPGLTSASVVRDIAEDADGNIYVSSDLGVFKLDFSLVDQYFSFEQTSLFGPRSTESYALHYDSDQDRMLVSNELGILDSFTNGRIWTFSEEFDETRKIFKFVKSENSLFALTNDKVFRKNFSGNFVEIADFDATISRNLVIYNDMMYVSTDKGVYATDLTDDIYNDTNIIMKKSLPEINIGSATVTATSLNTIDNFLFIGTDSRLFIKNTEEVWIQYDNLGQDIPSVYVDGLLQQLGVRYNTVPNANNVSFDEKIDILSVVTVANQYRNYTSANNGWAFQNYSSDVDVYVNNNLFATTQELRDSTVNSSGEEIFFGDPIIPLDLSQFTGFQYPEATESNSYLQGANLALAESQVSTRRLANIVAEESGEQTESSLSEGETKADVVGDALRSIDKYLSLLRPKSRVLEVTDDSGNTTNETVELPSIEVSLTGVSYNATTGKFSFSSSLNKYDVVKSDILGSTIKNIGDNTHSEVEDKFELINSGLPSSLSRVQQANIVKLGIFNESQYPNEQAVCSTPYQATYIDPVNRSWYDVLNSTIDWNLQVSKGSVANTLLYATACTYISSEDLVFVGGPNGLIKIDSTNYNIEFVTINGQNLEIKDFTYRDSKLFVLTLKDLYFSTDFGVTWSKIDRTGLPDNLYAIKIISNNMVVGTEYGLYYKKFSNATETSPWLVGLKSEERSEIIIQPDLAFALVGDQVYFSTDGARWVSGYNAENLQVNNLTKFKSIIYVATPQGLYKDDGTFYGSDAKLSIEITQGTVEDSKNIIVNDVQSNGDDILVAGLSDGTLLFLNNNGWFSNGDLPLECIHKILSVEDKFWIFGYNKLIVVEIVGNTISKAFNIPFVLTTGVPIL